MQFFTWLESTSLARTVGESVLLTAGLSAAHLIGFTLVMSAGWIWNLRASGVLLSRRPLEAIARPAVRVLAIGLTISVLTGMMLFSPRASYTAPSGVFQFKMALFVGAASYQFALSYFALRRPGIGAPLLRVSGAVGLLLWMSLAIVACWFILFE
jgi:hypothetical protein